MNVWKRFTLGLALGALALGFAVTPASAEPVLKGSFELPAATYLGNTLLQPGQYTIWTSAEVTDLEHVPVVHLSGEGINRTFLAIARPDTADSRNFLEIADIDGTYVIRAFDAGAIGKTLAFGMTKSVRNKALRAAAQPVITVPVTSGAGL